jgi:hypothetical protein
MTNTARSNTVAGPIKKHRAVGGHIDATRCQLDALVFACIPAELGLR